MGNDASVINSERAITPPRYHVDYLQNIINEMCQNKSFYSSLYNEHIVSPLKRLKRFFDENEEELNKTKTTKSLPRNVQRDAKNVIKLYPIFNNSKEVCGKLKYYFFLELDNFFIPLLKTHKYNGLCDVNTSNKTIDLLSCGILNFTDFKVFKNRIDKLTSGKIRSESFIKNIKKNDLDNKQQIINIVANMLWYYYSNMGDNAKNIDRSYVVKIDNRYPDHIKEKKICPINLKITRCKRCRSSYYELKSTPERDKPLRALSMSNRIDSDIIKINPIYNDEPQESQDFECDEYCQNCFNTSEQVKIDDYISDKNN